LKQIYNLVKRFPENKIVLAHWGGGIFFFNLLKKDVKESLKNVYFDTAASPFLYDTQIYRYAKLHPLFFMILRYTGMQTKLPALTKFYLAVTFRF